MMINRDFFDLASLAEASYANITDYSRSGIKLALMSENFSDSQAEALLDKWDVVSETHRPNTNSGYSSTLFQNKEDGVVA